MRSTQQNGTLISGFLRSLRTEPTALALALGDLQLSYAELWERSGKLAHAIREHVDPQESLIAILAYRSVTAYSGILGILASGRGYVPLNPKFPVERTRAMLSASGCKVLVVGSECAETLKLLLPYLETSLTLVFPDPEWSLSSREMLPHKVISIQRRDGVMEPYEPQVEGNAPAYLLFTSGSTGVPKGVTVSHDNVRSYLNYAKDRYGIDGDDRCSQNFDLTFDLSVHDLFASWDGGAAVCPFTEQLLVPATHITEQSLTVWFSVPSVAMMASRVGLLEPGAFPTLRLSLFCGEALSSNVATNWQLAASRSIVENLYGPTETTIAITSYRWDPLHSPHQCVAGIVPIGWIFQDQQYRVIDQKLAQVSKGDTGELCLAGSQVTRGYLNDAGTTAQQFVQLPQSNHELWYRTGDLVKEDERGCLYYLGRRDQQVKINGYRVELAEVEKVLRDAADTELVAAVSWPIAEGTASGIVAIICGSSTFQDDRVFALCEKTLPKYMVPTHIYHFDELPLNVNGKIDREQIKIMLKRLQ